jgi:hypothetical protein
MFKRDVPFIGPVGEFGFNHFDRGTIASVMGGVRVRANTDRYVLNGLADVKMCRHITGRDPGPTGQPRGDDLELAHIARPAVVEQQPLLRDSHPRIRQKRARSTTRLAQGRWPLLSTS